MTAPTAAQDGAVAPGQPRQQVSPPTSPEQWKNGEIWRRSMAGPGVDAGDAGQGVAATRSSPAGTALNASPAEERAWPGSNAQNPAQRQQAPGSRQAAQQQQQQPVAHGQQALRPQGSGRIQRPSQPPRARRSRQRAQQVAQQLAQHPGLAQGEQVWQAQGFGQQANPPPQPGPQEQFDLINAYLAQGQRAAQPLQPASNPPPAVGAEDQLAINLRLQFGQWDAQAPQSNQHANGFSPGHPYQILPGQQPGPPIQGHLALQPQPQPGQPIQNQLLPYSQQQPGQHIQHQLVPYPQQQPGQHIQNQLAPYPHQQHGQHIQNQLAPYPHQQPGQPIQGHLAGQPQQRPGQPQGQLARQPQQHPGQPIQGQLVPYTQQRPAKPIQNQLARQAQPHPQQLLAGQPQPHPQQLLAGQPQQQPAQPVQNQLVPYRQQQPGQPFQNQLARQPQPRPAQPIQGQLARQPQQQPIEYMHVTQYNQLQQQQAEELVDFDALLAEIARSSASQQPLQTDFSDPVQVPAGFWQNVFGLDDVLQLQQPLQPQAPPAGMLGGLPGPQANMTGPSLQQANATGQGSQQGRVQPAFRAPISLNAYAAASNALDAEVPRPLVAAPGESSTAGQSYVTKLESDNRQLRDALRTLLHESTAHIFQG